MAGKKKSAANKAGKKSAKKMAKSRASKTIGSEPASISLASAKLERTTNHATVQLSDKLSDTSHATNSATKYPESGASKNIEATNASSVPTSAMEENTIFAPDATRSSDTPSDASQTASAKVQAPLEEFTLFPKLPIELRLKIWDEAMPGPRVIELLAYEFHVYNHCPTPPILHASRESRNCALKKYKALSAEDIPFPMTHALFNIPIDFDQDIVYFSFRTSSFVEYIGLCKYQKSAAPILSLFQNTDLQHVAFDFWETKAPEVLGNDLAVLKNLKTIAFVASDTCKADSVGYLPNPLESIPSRPITGFTEKDPAADIKLCRWAHRCKGFETENLKVSFNDRLGSFIPKFMDKMIEKRADETAVRKLNFIGIDIIRGGEDKKGTTTIAK